jgi:DUF1009 family protein
MTVQQRRLGLIAGGGDLPLAIAKAAIDRGEKVVAATFENTSADLVQFTEDSGQFKVSHLGRIIEFLRSHSVTHLCMAGQVDHSEIFSAGDFDSYMLSLINHEDNRAESLLSRLADLLETELAPVSSLLELLDSHVLCAGIYPEGTETYEEDRDLAFGWNIATEIARMNVGQSIVVKNGVVVAVEALEGTDGLIKRCSAFGLKAATLVKVPMPDKDPRFDVPIIGQRTLEHMSASGIEKLLVSAGQTLVLNKPQTFTRAAELGITISARSNES